MSIVKPDAEVIAEVRELDAKATKGPWIRDDSRKGSQNQQVGYIDLNADTTKRPVVSLLCNIWKLDGYKNATANADFIAAARTLLPDLANRLEAANRKSEWRPISEAPKDGTEILLWNGGVLIHAKWGGDFHNAWIFAHGIGFCDKATHFMPLPEPPTKPTP